MKVLVNLKFFFGSKVINKEVKLLVVLNSENNNTSLAPMLGQYMIKPVEFLDKLKGVFSFESDVINDNLMVSMLLRVKKNNSYIMEKRSWSVVYLYNVFCLWRFDCYFDFLFLWKVKVLCQYRFQLLYSLIERILSVDDDEEEEEEEVNEE